jgi:hypothetical protein
MGMADLPLEKRPLPDNINIAEKGEKYHPLKQARF